MTISIEHLSLHELKEYLYEQAIDAFPALQDKNILNMIAEKWSFHAEICTCRDESQRLVGMIAFYANQPETGVAYIPHVYVSDCVRGKGIFSEMLEVVKSYIRKKNFSSIRLEVKKENKRAFAAYIKKGFVVERDNDIKSNSYSMQLSFYL